MSVLLLIQCIQEYLKRRMPHSLEKVSATTSTQDPEERVEAVTVMQNTLQKSEESWKMIKSVTRHANLVL